MALSLQVPLPQVFVDPERDDAADLRIGQEELLVQRHVGARKNRIFSPHPLHFTTSHRLH